MKKIDELPGYFRGVEDEILLDELRGLLNKFCREQTFREGQLLWSEGDRDGMLISIITGSIKIYKLLPDGRTITLYIFNDGTLFGFMPFVDELPYPAFAQSIKETRAMTLSRDEFNEVIKKNPEISAALMKILARRLRQALYKIEHISSKNALPRVASALYSLFYENEISNIVDIKISAQEFAGLIGITAESFSRCVTDLSSKNIIEKLGFNKFKILKEEKLQEISLQSIF